MTAVGVVQDRTLPTVYRGKLEPAWHCRAWNEKRQKYCGARAGAGTDHTGVGRCRRHDGGGDQKLRHGQDRRYQLTNAVRVGALLERHLDDADPLNVLPELALLRALVEDYIERYEETTAALLAWHLSSGGAGSLPTDQAEALRRVLEEIEAIGYGGDELTEAQLEDLKLAREGLGFLAEPPAAKPATVRDVADAIRLLAEITKVVERIERIRAANAITYDQLKRFLFAVERALEVRIRAAFERPEDAARLIAQLRNDFLQIRP